MDAFPSSSAEPALPAAVASSSSSGVSPWPELLAEPAALLFSVGRSWPTSVEQDARAMTTTEEDDDGAGGAAVACEAVEFEDLFANPIAQGSNLEFRVSRVTGGGNDVAVETSVVKKSEVVVVDMVDETEGLVQVDVSKAEVTEMDVMEAFQDGSDDVKVDEEADGRVALNKLELHTKTLDSQVGELLRIVTLQYRLTGANPLEQELVSAVLGTNEGRQGCNLSAETLTYLKDVFAIKDTLTKTEYRYIALNCGATQTQVREFFASQKSRVKAFIQQCTDEAKPHISYQIVSGQPDQILGNDIGFTKLTDVDSVEILLETMRQERYFTQQEKLLQIILGTDPGLILRRFLEKGGLKVLCAWLVAAAADEQTSVLRQLLQVLSHLPMSCAVPLQVSALLQPVNKLRFYFVQDVANHARILMSKWSNLFMNKVESGMSMDSAGLGPATKDGLDVPQRVQKRQRDPGMIMKKFEGGLSKKKTVESVKGQSDVVRASVRTLSPGEAMKLSPGLAHAATKAAGGHVAKPKFDLKSKTMIKDLPNYNTSKMKALAAVQRNFREIVPRKGVPQPQTESKPRLSEIAVVDEITANEALNVGANNPVSSTSSSTQAPKARGAYLADDEPKGAAKVAVAMSTIWSSGTFPVSDAANIATPVSRKHSLGDQHKERRKVLPVEDLGNGNRWRESTARRPVIEVGKTSRPLSADEIRKAKLRARLMQLPTAGTSGNKSVSTPELYSSRGKPTPVGDGWSLDRYASMDGGDKPTLLRPTTSNLDVTSAPRQILGEKTFDLLLAEQASEAKVLGFEQAINTQRSPIYVGTLEKGAVSSAHLQDGTFPESDSNLGQDTSIQLDITNDGDTNPLSPSIAVALSENSTDVVSEVAEDIGVINDPVNVLPQDPVNVSPDSVAVDSLMEHAPEESGGLDVIAPENVTGKGIEAHFVRWVVPSVLNLNPAWGVVAGDASKELGFQAARVKREEEEIYSDLRSIPDNPKDLWDEEPIYDDTLTTEIPVEVLETTSSKTSSPSAVVNQGVEFKPSTNGNSSAARILGEQHVAASTNTFVAAQQSGDAAPGHDPNLLALLLSNPHLVSQLASQQKGDSGLAGLSALLGLENGGFPSVPREVPSQPTNNSNFLPPMQPPREEIVNTGNFQGGLPLSTSAGGPFSEPNTEPMRIVEDAKAGGAVAAPVSSWDVHPDWALPTPPPPASLTGATMPPQQQQANNSNNLPPPPPGSVPPQEFVSSVGLPAAYNGSFQKLPNAPYTWAPLNTLMHTTAKLQFESPLGRGRPPPVVSHNVNGGMTPSADHVVDDAAAATAVSSSSSSGVFGQAGAAAGAAAAQFNPVGWPPHGMNHPVNVVNNNHHNVANVQGNVTSSWNANVGFSPDFQQQQQRLLPEPPLPSLWRPASAPSSLLPAPPPLPPFLAHQNSSNQYWQPQDPTASFRPAPPPSHHMPLFRPSQDCRSHHPPSGPQWHLNGSNYGSNR